MTNAINNGIIDTAEYADGFALLMSLSEEEKRELIRLWEERKHCKLNQS